MTQTILKIKNRELTYGTMNFEFFSSGIGKILGNAGAEFVIYDQEHSNMTYEQLKTLSLVSNNPLTITRVPALEYHLIAKSLDAGAKGIMCPKIETKEQAEKLVEYSRYRPQGKRGLGLGIAHDYYPKKFDEEKTKEKKIPKSKQFSKLKNQLKELNNNIIVIALIETEEGINNCEEILSVPGIDVGWLGHYDLTDSMNIVGDFENKKYWNAVEKFVKACKINNKPAGILDSKIDFIKKKIKKGFTVIGYGHDIAIFQEVFYQGINKLKNI